VKKVSLLLTILSIFAYQTLLWGQVEILPRADTLPMKPMKIEKRPWAASLENLGINVLVNRMMPILEIFGGQK
jgi:hypothetical protein